MPSPSNVRTKFPKKSSTYDHIKIVLSGIGNCFTAIFGVSMPMGWDIVDDVSEKVRRTSGGANRTKNKT